MMVTFVLGGVGLFARGRELIRRFAARHRFRSAEGEIVPIEKRHLALDDGEALVRHHAARALLASHGPPAESAETEHMIYRVMSNDAGRREGGKRDILASIAGRSIVAEADPR